MTAPKASSTISKNDPLQWRNLWDDPSAAAMKKDLLDDLRARTPKQTRAADGTV